jgi:hypothetical protein
MLAILGVGAKRIPESMSMALVELTAADGGPLYVNPEQVRFVAPEREGRTEVVFDAGLSVVMREDLAAVAQTIGRG